MYAVDLQDLSVPTMELVSGKVIHENSTRVLVL